MEHLGRVEHLVQATNIRHSLDDAFLRRLDFVIDFPFPDEADRERIWRVLLPASAPRSDDIYVAFLAERSSRSPAAASATSP